MRCLAKTRDVWWRKSKDGQCPFAATFVINEKHLCSRHASMVALELALKEGSAVSLFEKKVETV